MKLKRILAALAAMTMMAAFTAAAAEIRTNQAPSQEQNLKTMSRFLLTLLLMKAILTLKDRL